MATSPFCADHNKVTRAYQCKAGEKSSDPGIESRTIGLSCRSGGEATAASFP